MPDDVTDLPKNPDFSQYTHGPNSGNALVDILTALLTKGNFNPFPGPKQDIYDAFMQQSRSRAFMQIKSGDAFGANQMFQQFGLNPNSTFMRYAGMGMGDPNGPAMRMLSPLIGGNPVAAQMQAYAGFTGMTAGAFGNVGNMSMMQSDFARQALTNSFYQQKTFDYDGAKADINRRGRQSLIDDPSLKAKYGFSTAAAFDVDKLPPNFAPSHDVLTAIQNAQSDMGVISSSGVEKDKKKLIEARAKLLEKELVGKVDAEILKQYIDISKTSNGGINLAGLTAAVSATDPMQKYARENAGLEGKKGTKVYGPIDYAKSRGFNLEEFESAAVTASDLRLMTGRPDQMAGAGATFLDHGGGGTLSAARSVFGNKSSSELIRDISGLYGSGSTNLLTDKGNQEVESMLRDMKSASRMAGTSIDTVLGIINEAKILAQSHPDLRYISGQSVTKMSLHALGAVQQLNTVMDANSVRRSGGAMGMTTGMISEQTALANSDVSKGIGALYNTYKNNPAALQVINDFTSGKHGPMTPGGLSAMMTRLQSATGRSFGQIQQDFQDPLNRALGAANPDAAAAGLGAANDALFQGMYGGLTDQQRSHLSQVIAGQKANGGRIDFQQAFSEIGASSRARRQVAMLGNTAAHLYQMRTDPAYARSFAENENRKKQMSRDAAVYDQKYAHLHAPIIQQMYQKLSSGEVSSGGLSSLYDIFRTRGMDDATVSKEKGAFTVYGEAMTKFADEKYRSGDPAAARSAAEAAGAKFLGTMTGTDATGEELKDAISYLQNGDKVGSFAEAKRAVAALEGGSAADQKRAKILRSMGVLDTESGFEDVRKNGVRGLGGALAKRRHAEVIDKAFSGERSALESQLSRSFGGLDADTKAQLARGYGTDGIKGLYGDLASGKDFNETLRSRNINLTDEQKAALGNATKGVQERALELETKKKAALGDSAGGKKEDLMSLLEKLVKAVTGDFPKAMKELTEALISLKG